MREIAPRVSFMLPRPRQAQGRSDALRILAVADPPGSVALGDRLQVALQTRRGGFAPLTHGKIADQPAVRAGRQHVHPAVDADRYTGFGQRADFAFAFQASVPAAVAFHQPCSSEVRNAAAFAQFHQSYAWNAQPRLVFVQAQRTVTMWKGQLVPASRRFESRIPGSFAAFEPPEKPGERQIQAVQHRIFAFAINRRDTRILLSQRREFGVLVATREGPTSQAVDVAPLLQ